MPRDARFWLPVPPWMGADPAPAAVDFDPGFGFPWTVEQDFPPSPIYWDLNEQSWAVQPPLNVAQLTAWTIEGHLPDQTVRAYDPTDQPWPVQVFAAVAFDPANGFPWTTEQHFPPSPIFWDLNDQSWAIRPPLNVGQLTAWTDPQPDVSAPLTFDPTDQSWAIQPPAAVAFDPSSGFPWNGDPSQDRATWPLWYDPSEQAWAVQPPLNADSLDAFTSPQADPAPPLTYDPSEQAWSVGPPLNVGQLTAWTDPQADPAPPLAYDPTEQAWAIQTFVVAPFDPSAGFPWTTEQHFPDQTRREYDGQDSAFGQPPLNVDKLSAFTDPHDLPDQARREYDGQDAAFGGPPIASVVFDPSTGFPWTVADGQQDRSTQPTWYDALDGTLGQPPLNVDRLSAFTDSHDLPDQTVARYDGQDGALGLVPSAAPFDPANGAPWQLDPQQDRSTWPTWYDPHEQSWSVGPPLNVASLSSLWNGSDPQQDRSLQPVWYTPDEVSAPWSGTFVIVPTVLAMFGPTGQAMAPAPTGSVSAPGAAGSANAPTPAGTATSPAPDADASAPAPEV